MRVYLAVPYAQKDQAKALGARWDPYVKKWYIENPNDLKPFIQWMPECQGFKELEKPKKSNKSHKEKHSCRFRNNIVTYPAAGIVILPYDDFGYPPWEGNSAI